MLAICTLTAQNTRGHQNETRKEFRQKMMKMSTEQIADLRTKKLTLALNLDAKQQQKIKEFQVEILQNHKNRKKDNIDKRKLTSDEIYITRSARLDAKINTKQEMKRILNEDQYQAWENLARKKYMERKNTFKRRSL